MSVSTRPTATLTVVHVRTITGMDDPRTFIDGARPGDVVQGALGNCWYADYSSDLLDCSEAVVLGRFCSALSILTTHKGLLKNVLVSDEHAARGLYTVKFSKSGLWRCVAQDTASSRHEVSLPPSDTCMLTIAYPAHSTAALFTRRAMTRTKFG